MGKNPMAILSGNDELIIDEKGNKTVVKGKLLDGVKDYIKSINVTDDYNLPFTGGAVGAIGYDIIKQYEKIPAINREVVDTPTVHLMVFDEFIIYDHLHDRIKIVVLADNEKNANVVLDRWKKRLCPLFPAEHYTVKEPSSIKFTY